MMTPMNRLRISPDHRRLLAFAVKAVRAGERAALAHFDHERMQASSYKKHHEIVTKGDTASNAAVIVVLKKLTPTIPICSEEGADIKADEIADAELAWVLDPLDGTSNYAVRLPLWGISLALVVRSEPIIGVISLPSIGQLFTTILGGGAWMGKKRLSVSRTKKLRDAVAFMCYGYKNRELHRGVRIASTFAPRVLMARRLGAAVVESTWIASGRADFSILNGVRPWDVAAGALLVREAGGKALALTGKGWTIADADIIFTTPTLASQVLRILRR
jgi:myo-inositol-1(or 4)-monophosphatase